MLVQSAKIGAPLVNVDSMQWWDSTKKKLRRLYGQRVGPKTFSKLRRIKNQEIIRRLKIMLIGIKVADLMRRTRPKLAFV
jgi:hypothetical protein